MDDSEIINRRSDLELREKVQRLTFENPGDESTVAILFRQNGLSENQRIWLNRLLARNGAAFNADAA